MIKIEWLRQENGGWHYIIHSINPATCWRKGNKKDIESYHYRNFFSRICYGNKSTGQWVTLNRQRHAKKILQS